MATYYKSIKQAIEKGYICEDSIFYQGTIHKRIHFRVKYYRPIFKGTYSLIAEWYECSEHYWLTFVRPNARIR